MPVAPPTAYAPGTRLVVGSHDAEIVKFIGEGGFAHVYTVRVQPPLPGRELACLKRVQVPTKAYLNILRAEVGAMQRLRGSSNVVQYVDSHAERMHTPGAEGQYEVFLLMEFCERGGLIDLMNARLRDQLREHEILKIMYDITLGLARMHYLQPPLLHRDLKIENVLISADGTFKLCDFGSVSPVLPPPKTPQELKALDDDIQHHTTVQYRAPEMLDLARGLPVDEKSDIWALGVFLYKLCFYTTPFERAGQTYEQFKQLVLAGQFAIPPRPAYSERLKNMVRVLLQPDPRARPNVFQVMQEICAMRHVDCPLADIYSLPRAPGMPVPNLPALVIPPVLPKVPLAQGPPLASPASAPALAALAPPHAVAPAASAPAAVPAPASAVSAQVLALSPGGSPALRAVSPLPDDVELRYPSLEDLDRLNPSLIDLNSPKVEKDEFAPAPAPRPAPFATKPLKVAPPGASAPAAAAKPITPGSAGKPASAAPGVAAGVAAPAAHPAAQPAPAPQPVPAAPAAAPDPDDEPRGSEKDKLQRLLTDISTRSSTVILESDEQRNLSSVEFLRALNTGGSVHRKRSRAQQHKPTLSRFYNKKYASHEADMGSSDEDEAVAALDPRDMPELEEQHSRSAPASPRLAPADRPRRSGQSESPSRRQSTDASRFDVQAELGLDLAKKPKPRHKPLLKPKPRRSVDLGLGLGAPDYDRAALQSELKPGGRERERARRSLDFDRAAYDAYDADTSAQLRERERERARRRRSADARAEADARDAPKPELKPKPRIAPEFDAGKRAAEPPSPVEPKPPKPQLKPVKPTAKPPLRPKPAAAAPAPQPAHKSLSATSASELRAARPAALRGPRPLPRPKSVVLPVHERHEPLRRRLTGSDDDSVETASLASSDALSMTDTGSEFRPSNSIQQRVYQFLNSQHQQHPPRRTASGYGRYTDEYARGADDDGSPDVRSKVDSLRL